ncbi:SURF1 family protein [Pelagovum pacificum]|uniref:SURF1-like protein n=1 Tax=Pelagovum pacificum TaxID=2588711 RepID=A0A5C5GGS6_9RHOB|nr:SURF1 family protein [Pelagovum pacificum]QQA44135.1 SURF1 family protein [Pelagovum pacificum]TNY32736.1 SURF1 family protein [Pelagovum pacificum]
MRRLIFPILYGLGGCAILIALGVWQIQRLEWKTAILDEIEATIAADPVPLPSDIDPEADRYLPVETDGQVTGQGLRVLVTPSGLSAGYRRIVPFEVGDRTILLDAGWVELQDDPRIPEEALQVVGNLHWPQERDGWTPEPEGDLWFVRDVAAMAEALDTEPVMLIGRSFSPTIPTVPLPVGTEGIKNDHLEYAITWFLLALVWAGMTGYLVVRTLRKKEE